MFNLYYFQRDLTNLWTIEFFSVVLLTLHKDFFFIYHSSVLFKGFNTISPSKITLQSDYIL